MNISSIIVALSLSFPIFANDVSTKVISVYDGDTFTIEQKDIADKNYRVRIRGIDTAEYGWRAQCIEETSLSIKAKTFTSTAILNKEVLLKDIGTDKYGRLLADVYVDVTEKIDGLIKPTTINIGTELLKKELAKPYNPPQQKPKWCK